MNIKPILEILEKEQPKVESIIEKNGICSILTQSFSNSDYGNIHIRFYIQYNELRISHLFLIKQNQGTGTKLLQYFIKNAEEMGLEKISILNVRKNNIPMKKLCIKFKMQRIIIDNEFVNYTLIL